MKRLVIAIDCDDVLVATTPYFVAAYNRTYGTQVDINRAHELHYDAWGVDHDTVLARLAQLQDTDEYRMIGPSEEEIAVIKELAQDHELHVVTARRPHERELTQATIDRFLPGLITSLELVGFEGSKGEVCQRLGADILIDDSARHLKNAIEMGLPERGAILFGEYVWNTEGNDTYKLCKTWSQVAEYIRVYANESQD